MSELAALRELLRNQTTPVVKIVVKQGVAYVETKTPGVEVILLDDDTQVEEFYLATDEIDSGLLLN